MKKIKLFALAAFAMLSTNAFAFDKEATVGIWKIQYTNGAAPADGQIIGFRNDVVAADVKDLKFPATLTDNENGGKVVKIESIADNAFKKDAARPLIQSIETIDMTEASNLKTIGKSAFEGAEKLTTVKFGGAFTKIDVNAFKGCVKLANVLFATAAAGISEQKIEGGVFEGTALTELDLTNAKIADLNQLFTYSGVKNKTLTKITLPITMKNITSSAFEDCQTLAEVLFATAATGEQPLTIEADAFYGTIFLEALELPARLVRLADNALAGSSIEALTINSNATAKKPTIGGIVVAGDALTSIVVKGEFKGIFGLADDETTPIAVAPTLTSLTFQGKVSQAGALGAGSFVDAAGLATVTFSGDLTAAGVVAAGAFGDGTDYAGKGLAPKILTVTYNPTEADAVKVLAFDKAAFAPSGTTPYVAKLETATWYKTFMGANAPFKVNVAAAAVTKAIEVANNGEGKYFYASFLGDADYKIAAAQNDGKVMVYGAYMDQVKSGATVTNTAYMDQLTIIEGNYWIPAGEPVIIKSTTSADVVAEAPSVAEAAKNYDSRHFTQFWDTEYEFYYIDNSNAIDFTGSEMFGKELKALYPGEDVYMLAPFDEYGMLWSKFKDTRTIEEGTFFLTVPAAAGARLNVVWLDGSEEDTTAIQAVKNVVEDDAIYNLAGQKVSASYKGVVIKNGKKMIQK